jgi:hypothetical protein
VRTVNDDCSNDIRATFDFIAGIFGFEHASSDNWFVFKQWCELNDVDLTLARGPHVITILKIMAAKRGRTGVSTLSSE